MQSSSFEDYEAKKIKEYRALYDAGRSELKQEEYERATRNFSQLIKEAPPVEFRRQALLQLALVANKQVIVTVNSRFILNTCHAFQMASCPCEFEDGTTTRDQMGAMDQAIEQFHTVIAITTRMSDIKMLSANGNIALKAKARLQIPIATIDNSQG